MFIWVYSGARTYSRSHSRYEVKLKSVKGRIWIRFLESGASKASGFRLTASQARKLAHALLVGAESDTPKLSWPVDESGSNL